MKKNSVLKSKLFLGLFCIPSILWIIISIIPDETDPEPLTVGEIIAMDIVMLLIWFIISFSIVYLVNKFSKKDKANLVKIDNTTKEATKENKTESQDKYLYKIESIVDAYEYKRMAKYFPKRMYWVFVLNDTFYTLILTAIIGLITKSIILASYFFILRQVYTMGINSVRLEHFAEKVFNHRRKKYNIDINVETEFYDTYFIRKDSKSSLTINYSDISRCVETDTNFYFEYPKNNRIIIIQKNACDLKLIDFIRSKFSNIENKLGDEIKFKKHLKPRTIKVFMLILFIATLLCFYGAGSALILINSITKYRNFSVFRNIWVFWCFVPIPLASIIFGYKYRNQRFKCTKNIVAGYIVGIFLVLYGSFFLFIPSFKEDYSKINDYKEYMDATIPDNGDLEIIKFNTYNEEDKKDYTEINAYYDKEDTTTLEESIESSKNWLKGNEVKSELKIFMPVRYTSSNRYYLVYNKTTGEYNTIPSESGKYEIYTMMYDKTNKMLVIHTYNYLFR